MRPAYVVLRHDQPQQKDGKGEKVSSSEGTKGASASTVRSVADRFSERAGVVMERQHVALVLVLVFLGSCSCLTIDYGEAVEAPQHGQDYVHEKPEPGLK